jgi:hypothetical protein
MGEATGLVDDDRHVVELATGRTIALRLHVSFLTSLFQHLGLLIRTQRQGATETDVDAGIVRLAAACPPIEILRWGEYAARDAAEFSDVEQLVRRRAEDWASELASAMKCFGEGYRNTSWPQEKTTLLEHQRWLTPKLSVVKDDIIFGLRRGLLLAEDNRPVDVVLVRTSYDIAGAHSHPALVDTSRFAGGDLIEVLFHEVGHELLDRSVGLSQSGIAMLNRAFGPASTHEVPLYDVLHVLLFAQAGNLVREHFDQSHQPLLYKGDRLARALQRMHLAAPQADVIDALDRYSAGQIEIDQLAKIFTNHSARSAPRA